MLTHLSLFSGIGGLDLAAEWAGFETVGQCEWADYPTKVLEKHWPDVPRWRDIRTLTKESFYERTGRETVDIISGGFPCQPFSVAGKQKGKGDDRYLWPEMLRVITDIKPRWVLGENVPGILRIAAQDVITDLERAGYEVVVFDFEAAAVGAPHRRERIAFVAHRNGSVCIHSQYGINAEKTREYAQYGPAKRSETMADTNSIGPQRNWASGEQISRTRFEKGETFGDCTVCDTASCGLQRDIWWNDVQQSNDTMRWPTEPTVGRVANGVPHWVDRIKCLGNAVVPQQFYPIFKAIAEVENGQTNNQK